MRSIFKSIFFLLVMFFCVCIVSADVMIEDFEPPTQSTRVSSYPGEDLQPNYWRFDSNQGAGGTNQSLYLYGNTWKIYDISDYSTEITPDSIWQIYVRIPSTATIAGFGITDGTNELIYTFEATETPPTSDEWIVTYTGWKNTSSGFQAFKLPVGRDFNDRYGPFASHQITGLIFINDEDTSGGTVYFDQIEDITESEPQPPVVDAGSDITLDVGQGFVFSCDVTDPDSSSFDYNWDFADGDTHGSATPWHAFIEPGIYNVLVTVEDNTGQIGMDSLQVVVGQNPPEPVASMTFAGDIMFGRRFEDPDDTPQLISPGDQGSGAMYIGSFTRGLSTDLKVVNMESPITDEGTVHPAKQYTFRSRPDSVAGLTECGAELICLANNHIIDYMDRGVEETFEVLNNPTSYSPYARDVDFKYAGAGMNREEATRPTFFTQNGLRVGFVGLCSITGHSGNEQPYFEAGYDKPGVLYLNEPNVRNSVARSEAVADITVVMIHGGVEYSDEPSDYVQPLAQLAVDCGAEMVICHHPHVSQGIEIYHDVPIVYSLGNYIFDQKYQHTMMSYMVDTRVDFQGCHQMSIVPIYVEQFIPKFLVGEAGIRTIERLMRLSEFLGTTIVPDTENCRGIVELGPAEFQTSSQSESLDLPTSYESAVSTYVSQAWEIPDNQHLLSINSITGVSGSRYLMMGKDMLMFGSFEEEDLDDDLLESPGWDIPGSDSAKIHDYDPYQGDLSLRLRRHRSHSSEISVSTYRRMPLDSSKKYLVCGYIRTHEAGDAWVTVTSHYWPYTWDDWRDEETTVFGPISGDNEWQYFEGWFSPQYDLEWATVQVHLEPWSGSETYGYAYFDDLHFVEFDETYNPMTPMMFPNPGGHRFLALRSGTNSPSAAMSISLSEYSAVDLDNDGLWDFLEDVNGDGILQRGETSAGATDSDGDGVSDGEEFGFGADGYITRAYLPDSDGDGYSDGQEMASGTNPVDDESHPTGPTATPTPTPSTPTATPTPTQGDCYHTGDVDFSGDVTAGDAQTAFFIVLGTITPSYEESCAADCNGDDEVTSGDAQAIFMAALGTGNCVDPV